VSGPGYPSPLPRGYFCVYVICFVWFEVGYRLQNIHFKRLTRKVLFLNRLGARCGFGPEFSVLYLLF
jgi:hypothetical protein